MATVIPRTDEQPELTPCDLVMKGGVASGIVYPGAIAEIAERYRFHGIGGASAGAIGAIGAAAAELGRYRGGEHCGFARVRRLVDELQEERDLIGSLFQAQPATRPLFNTAVAITEAGLGERESLPSKIWTIYRSALPNFGRWALIGGLIAALPAGLLLLPGIVLAIREPVLGLLLMIGATVIALALLFAGSAAGMAYRALRSVSEDVRANFWGLCSGKTEEAYGGMPALTDWMHQLVNELAGQDPEGDPVTFGHLWRAGRPGPHVPFGPDAPPGGSRDIDLQVITTCLTEGRPYRFPFDPDADPRQRFYFDPEEFRQLFPERIVDWLVKRSAPDVEPVGKYLPLPHPENLPIIMAARLSLSFPVLLSAVPLYAIRNGELVCCWFSDGGISSNFPIHFFDSPVPRWPTLAINLSGPPQHGCSEAEWEEAQDDPGKFAECQGRSVWFAETGRDPHRTIDNLTEFGWSIFNTARNWSDNTQSSLPGYRDRIIFVGMGAEEGGLNLRMPLPIRKRLAGRGSFAGTLMAARFHAPSPGGPRPTTRWTDHRWTRYRSSMAVIEDFLASFRRGYRHPEADPAYHDLIESGVARDQYPWEDSDHMRRALSATENLADLAATWHDDGAQPQFGVNAPKPESELRIRPPV